MLLRTNQHLIQVYLLVWVSRAVVGRGGDVCSESVAVPQCTASPAGLRCLGGSWLDTL